MNESRLWERKLLALLHDPPEKSYDYGPVHEQRAAHHASNFGVSAEEWKAYKSSDWTASAADRFIMPAGKAAQVQLGAGVSFTHPLTGRRLFQPADFPSPADATEILDQVSPDFGDPGLTPRERVFFVWRLWMEYAASCSNGNAKGIANIPYLPADTRIPDHTIWHHNSIASALEATRNSQGTLRPAFLLFQLGPVQDFIAQARSTRDLWSGSYLIAWLMAHALKKVADDLGPDAVIFPSLRGQPLFDWLYRDVLQKARYKDAKSYWDSLHPEQASFQERVLSPTLPNRFLAVVPADYDAAGVAAALQDEWRRITAATADWLAQQSCPIPHPEAYDGQVREQWRTPWQVWPWQTTKQALELLKALPGGPEHALQRSHQVAVSIPKEHQDGRCYRENALDSGWAWSAHYQICQYRLDARRQTRDFTAWKGIDRAVKDVYSGKEETVIDEKWLESASGRSNLSHLFKTDREFLGAANLVKRVWHKAYLDAVQGLPRATVAFDSVPAVAAAPWRNRMLDRIKGKEDAWSAFMDFKKTIESMEKPPFDRPPADRESEWIKAIDAGVFQEGFWNDSAARDPDGVNNARKSLNILLKAAKCGRPASYYAVLALDGDRMGEWVSGDRTPKVREAITPAAAEYFAENIKPGTGSPPVDVAEWLDGPRPVSPAYHLQFSEALSNFALYAARRIVEAHQGRLIYAGGDDVLAMLPAEAAIPCARGLRLAFQGDPGLPQRYPDLFVETKPGMIRLKSEPDAAGGNSAAEPSWPLLVPGDRATVSVGIAMGHIKEPLQDMTDAARRAEQRAKHQYDRDALAITLFKRSGEQIEWGTKFVAPPFDLLAYLDEYYKPPVDDPNREMPISGKFPYRICELMRVYEQPSVSGGSTPVSSDLAGLLRREIRWAVSQLRPTCLDKESIKLKLERLIVEWLNDVCGRHGALADFYNLFAIEAFIARQGE